MIKDPLKESAMMPSSESLSNISQSLRPGECIIRHVESSEVEDVSLLKNPYASEWFIIKLILGVINEWISSLPWLTLPLLAERFSGHWHSPSNFPSVDSYCSIDNNKAFL